MFAHSFCSLARAPLNRPARSPMHSFFYHFPPAGGKCSVTATSVIGHLLSTDFDEDDASVTGHDPATLYGSRTRKIAESSTKKYQLDEHLVRAAREADYLFLWLDCDREGENICFEVLTILRANGLFLDEARVHRAKFSAVAEADVKRAFARPGRLNDHESQAVDARQELDLKIGCSFTRFLTRKFLDGARATFRDPALHVLSYGPCQTPTLYLCVARDSEIRAFVARPFWTLHARAVFDVPGGGKRRVEVDLEWSRKRTFVEAEATAALEVCRRAGGRGRVSDVKVGNRTKKPPLGLNTVAMLRGASMGLGLSPQRCMEVAEKLYTSGYISYPRTESSRYPPSYDLVAVLRSHQGHDEWGNLAGDAAAALQGRGGRAPGGGVDNGDHPPITPMRCCHRGQLRGAVEWRLYDMICRHFIASLMPDMQYQEHTCVVSVGNKHGGGGGGGAEGGGGKGKGNTTRVTGGKGGKGGKSGKSGKGGKGGKDGKGGKGSKGGKGGKGCSDGKSDSKHTTNKGVEKGGANAAVWSCEQCTLDNNATSAECQACGYARTPKSPPDAAAGAGAWGARSNGDEGGRNGGSGGGFGGGSGGGTEEGTGETQKKAKCCCGDGASCRRCRAVPAPTVVQFTYTWHVVIREGWVRAMPWRLRDMDLNLGPQHDAVEGAAGTAVAGGVGGDSSIAAISDPRGSHQGPIAVRRNDPVKFTMPEVRQAETEPPPHLREAELIQLMDTHGIGTLMPVAGEKAVTVLC